MDYEAFKALVREMRTAQKDTEEARTHLKIMDPNFAENFDKFAEADQRSKALEKRVDDELAQKVETDPKRDHHEERTETRPRVVVLTISKQYQHCLITITKLFANKSKFRRI